MYVVRGNPEPKQYFPFPSCKLSAATLFAVGDTVTWASNASTSRLAPWYKKLYGDGPFCVEKITFAENELINGVSYGTIHPQTLQFKDQNGCMKWVNGSWFTKIEA